MLPITLPTPPPETRQGSGGAKMEQSGRFTPGLGDIGHVGIGSQTLQHWFTRDISYHPEAGAGGEPANPAYCICSEAYTSRGPGTPPRVWACTRNRDIRNPRIGNIP